MKSFLFTRLTALFLAAFMLLSLVACGSGTKSDASAQNGASAASAAPAATPAFDVKGKYSPEIELTAWRYLQTGIKFENNDTIDNNIYTKAYKEKFGINLKYVWTVPQEQFDQKVNVAIASGDLPDIMWLRNKHVVDLTENGLLADLTDIYYKNASPLTKEIMLGDEVSFNTAKVGGRLMSIPYTTSAIDSMNLFWVRTDWLKKLGLPEPKTMRDVLTISEAFTKKDPDGNGKNDTFGLAVCKTFLTETHANLNGFLIGYHAYPRRWVKDASGKLMYGSILSEAKAALKQLQDMYKDGQLDKEFGVKDRAKVIETIGAGKVGVKFGTMSSPLSVLQPSVDNDPNADWKAYPLVSVDDKPATPIAKMPIQLYYGINKKCKNPEAIMKIIEFNSIGYSPEADNEYGTNKNGIAVYQYQVIGFEPAKKNLNAHYHLLDAFKNNDPSKLNVEEKGYYDKMMDVRKGNKKFWGTERVFGTPSSFDVIGKYVDDKNMIYDGFYGAPTPTMVEKLATLEKMEDEVYTKIIMGQDISTFDKFVEDWKKLGGDQITKEINDWAAKNK